MCEDSIGVEDVCCVDVKIKMDNFEAHICCLESVESANFQRSTK